MKFLKHILFFILISISISSLKAFDSSYSFTEKSMEVNLYPNPVVSGEVLTIIAKKDIERIEVMNIVGQLMKIEDYTETSQVKLNIDELKEGIYFIKILFVDKTSSTRRLWVK